MKIKSGFILKNVSGNNIVIAVGARSKELNSMIKLNESATFLWQKLATDVTANELVEALMGEYGIDRELAEKDVDAFIGILSEAGIIEG